MDTNLIERLAREAGFEVSPRNGIQVGDVHIERTMQRFATLIAEHCAQLVEANKPPAGLIGDLAGHRLQDAANDIRSKFAPPVVG